MARLNTLPLFGLAPVLTGLPEWPGSCSLTSQKRPVCEELSIIADFLINGKKEMIEPDVLEKPVTPG
jgi:hypothetical protein